MPIYEFRCVSCNKYFELLVMKTGEEVEMSCPECKSEEFERIMSTTAHHVTGGGSDSTGVNSQTRNCSGGSCTTYDIPGPTG